MIKMEKEPVRHIAGNYYKDLKKHFKKIIPQFETVTIHQFRVAFKKHRAFLRLISMSDGTLKIPKAIKKAYHIAGQIRDLQLQQQRIRAVTKDQSVQPVSYLRLIEGEISKLKPALDEIFLDNPFTEEEKAAIEAVPEELPLSIIRAFIQQKWSAVYVIVSSGSLSDDDIHSVRKNLKDLFYMLKICEGVAEEVFSNSVWKKADENAINTLLEELGGFQDSCTSITLLRSRLLKQLNTTERTMLENTRKLLYKEKAQKKQSLLKKMKTGK